MRNVLIATAIATTAFACQADLFEELDTKGQAITEGQLSSPGAHPETAFLWLGGGMCTGTLVAPQVVLTARHCISGVNRVEVYFGNDPDTDRHGIVTPSEGLLNPNHYLAVAIEYLLAHRPAWSESTSVGKTLVSSGLIESDHGDRSVFVG